MVANFFKDAVGYAMNAYNQRYNSDSACYVISERKEPKDYVRAIDVMHNNWKKLRENNNAEFSFVPLELTIFTSEKSKDYAAWFAYLNAYNKIMDYYRYWAQYNKKDEELEELIKDWNRLIKPKQNVLSMVTKFIRQK